MCVRVGVEGGRDFIQEETLANNEKTPSALTHSVLASCFCTSSLSTPPPGFSAPAHPAQLPPSLAHPLARPPHIHRDGHVGVLHHH